MDETARQDEALAELLALGMAAARAVQAKLVEAEDAKEVADLSLAFTRVSRSVRQTLALQAKLARAEKRDARDDAAEHRRDLEHRVAHRRDQVRTHLERLIWTEHEADEAERLIDDLDDLLTEEGLYAGFTETPVEQHIARLKDELGLTPAHAGESRDPGRASIADDPIWRSSA